MQLYQYPLFLASRLEVIRITFKYLTLEKLKLLQFFYNVHFNFHGLMCKTFMHIHTQHSHTESLSVSLSQVQKGSHMFLKYLFRIKDHSLSFCPLPSPVCMYPIGNNWSNQVKTKHVRIHCGRKEGKALILEQNRKNLWCRDYLFILLGTVQLLF